MKHITDAILLMIILAGISTLLCLGGILCKLFWNWISEKIKDNSKKTYRIDYLFGRFSFDVAEKNCFVYPMDCKSYIYTKAKNKALALGKFYAMNLGKDYLVVKIEPVFEELRT